MSLSVGEGNAPPSVSLVPEFEVSQADDAAFLASSYGLTPDGWQFGVLEAWLAGRSGKWAAARCGLAVPRQNGKNALLEVRELFGMVALGERFLHTAHEVKTARKAFLRLAGFFENRQQWPELAALVESIRKTNGQEAILLRNGGSVEFVARSRGSGRGYTVDVLVCDEAQELSDEQLEALLPTISSAPLGNPQTVLTGTPPPPGTAGEVFTRYRQAALEGQDGRLSWHEWSVSGDVDPTDRELWYATNPALGVRLHEDVVESELTQMSAEGFARERLGSWAATGSSAVIDPDLWHGALADRRSKVERLEAFAVDVPPERKSASIAVAGRRRDGRLHVELVEQRDGTSWAVDRLVELSKKWKAPVVLDPAGPAGSLIVPLTQAGVEPALVGGREFAQACGAFVDACVEDRLRHIDQPALSVAVDAGRKRTLGDAWAWHRRDTDSDISPLVAATLAAYGISKDGPAEPKKARASFV